MLAHILGRLPCPKKTPRKIGNSMLAQFRYRMKIRKAKNCCRIINCPTQICKDRHKLANCNAVRIYIKTVKSNLQKRQLHYIAKRETFRKTASRCRTVGKITFRPHHKPGRCAISKWPGPVNALTFLTCQKKRGVPENQPQGQHWLSCGLRCKTREKNHINENTMSMNVKKK